MRTRKTLIPTVFASLLVLSSCGGSDGQEAAATTAVPDAPTTIQSAEPEATTTTAAPTTEAPTTEAPTTTEAEGLQSTSGGDPDRFCELSGSNDTLDAQFPEAFIDPEQTEQYLDALVPLLDEGREVAPAEISSDFDTLADAFTSVRTELAAVDYNLLLAADALEPLFDDPTIDAAGDAVSAWEAENCDGEPDTAMEDLDPEELNEAMEDGDITPELLEVLLATETGRQLFIEGMMSESSLTFDQAECFIDNVEIETLAALSTSEPTDEQTLEVLTAITDCEIPLDAFN